MEEENRYHGADPVEPALHVILLPLSRVAEIARDQFVGQAEVQPIRLEIDQERPRLRLILSSCEVGENHGL